MKKDGNISVEDYNGEFDTVQDDPSELFKIGDIFTLDDFFIKNPDRKPIPIPKKSTPVINANGTPGVSNA